MKKTLIALFGIFFTLSFYSYAQTEKVVIKTSGRCDMCASTIKEGLAFEKGIKKASVNTDNFEVTVWYASNKTNPDKIRKAITKVGYDADNLPADSIAYNKLADCCKKDTQIHKDR